MYYKGVLRTKRKPETTMNSELKMLVLWLIAVVLLIVIGGFVAVVTGSGIAGLVIAVIAVALAATANYDGLKEWATK